MLGPSLSNFVCSCSDQHNPSQPEDIFITSGIAFQNRTQVLPCYRVIDLEGIPIEKEPDVRTMFETHLQYILTLTLHWMTDG